MSLDSIYIIHWFLTCYSVVMVITFGMCSSIFRSHIQIVIHFVVVFFIIVHSTQVQVFNFFLSAETWCFCIRVQLAWYSKVFFKHGGVGTKSELNLNFDQIQEKKLSVKHQFEDRSFKLSHNDLWQWRLFHFFYSQVRHRKRLFSHLCHLCLLNFKRLLIPFFNLNVKTIVKLFLVPIENEWMSEVIKSTKCKIIPKFKIRKRKNKQLYTSCCYAKDVCTSNDRLTLYHNDT